MRNLFLKENQIERFMAWLRQEDRSVGTSDKYRRDLTRLSVWLDGRELNQANVMLWRDSLTEAGYAPVTVNSMLAAVNSYCRYAGLNIRVHFLRIQRRLFREERRELTRSEYERLLKTAQESGRRRLGLIIETIGASGIRVSELKYITVQAAQKGRAQITLKGKTRVILLPNKLCRKLLKYARKEKISSGEIFITGRGKGISRKQVWAEMKSLCACSGVEPDKVFPHNLRHMFAQVYYRACHDIVQLADVLGHSSIETTRIYLIGTGKEYARRLESLGLVR